MEPGIIKNIVCINPETEDDMRAAWFGTDDAYGSRQPSDPTESRALNLHASFHGETVEFRCFHSTLDAGKVKAYIQLCLGMSAKAINTRKSRWDQRPHRPETARYDFRCFLLSLGMIGKEFAVARKHLFANLG